VKRAALLAAVLVAAACGGTKQHSASNSLPESLKRLYVYNRSASLAERDNQRPYKERGATLHDISFRGSRGRRVNAFLMVPDGKGPFGGVVFQHGSGQDRSEFVAEALALAQRGAVGVLLDEPWVRSNSSAPPDRLARNIRQNYVDNVVDVRRAVDLLQSRPDVDGKRIGFVGHSYGAAIGAITSGVEPRIKALNLLSGGGTPSRGYAQIIGHSPAKQRAYRRLLQTIDPVRYIGHAAPRRLFIEAGRHDEIIPQPDLKALIAAASKPKRVKWFDAGHALTIAAFQEGADWLSGQLKLG
jgi:dienelactone hydrolase